MIFFLKLKVDGENEGATLEGVEDDKEYQISLSALYADGAQSEAVAIRYSTCESISHTYMVIQYVSCIIKGHFEKNPADGWHHNQDDSFSLSFLPLLPVCYL